MKEKSKMEKLKGSLATKLIIIGVLSLLLLIPAAMIKNLIREREKTRNEVIAEINSKWANEQTLTGPVITIPYKKYYMEDDKLITRKHYAHFLPENLDIQGELTPEIRYRSIYKVIVYNAGLSFTGSFQKPDFSNWNVNKSDILWDEAFIQLGITDMRGINNKIIIDLAGDEYEVNPGIPVKNITHSGVSSDIAVADKNNLDFNFKIDIKGSENLNFIPVGKHTRVHINSEWDSPSFIGAFLPDDREISQKGFSADWSVLHLNRNYPQQWTDSDFTVQDSKFGVELIFAVDQYQKSFRAAKYAFMFISLTFLTFFFSEIRNRKKIHPVQYLLVGVALCVFYTLLISLSEHLGFSLSYLVSAIATVSLIIWNFHQILKKRKLTLIVASVMTALYVFLYTILELEAYSLLMGSVGLFIIMAIIMNISKNIDWYSDNSNM